MVLVSDRLSTNTDAVITTEVIDNCRDPIMFLKLNSSLLCLLTRYFSGMDILDLQPNCYLSRLYLYIFIISYNRMVCLKGNIKFNFLHCSYTMSQYKKT